MVLVVSLVPQAVEACLRNLDRTRPAEGTKEVAKEGTQEKFTLIPHQGLGLEYLPHQYIKWHGGFRRPPNHHPTRKANKTKIGLWYFLSWLFEGEDEPTHPKDEYMLVRLPPYYKVKWDFKLDEGETEIQEKNTKVGFN